MTEAADVAHCAIQVCIGGWTDKGGYRCLFNAHGCALYGHYAAAVPRSQIIGCVESCACAIHQAIRIEWINVHAFDHPAELDCGDGINRGRIAKVQPGGVRDVDAVMKCTTGIAREGPDGSPGRATIGGAVQ